MKATDDAAGTARRRSPRLHPQIQASGEGAGVDLRRSARLSPPIHTIDEGHSVARRRSPRLHPQVHGSDEGAGVARRLSPRLHPQTHALGQEIGVARPRSTRFRPQIDTREEDAGVIRPSRRRRRRSSSAALASPLEDDDLLRKILLRLPPQPSSLPRASAVCKRWRCAVTDPRFHRRFCAHHRKPPSLGFFQYTMDGIVFKPILDPPNRIPAQRSFHLYRNTEFRLLGCHHGRVLVMSSLPELTVIAPITGEERRVSIPREFLECHLNGAVLCAAADHDHVHGSCHLSPFKVVLLSKGSYRSDTKLAFACVYSSETGIWSHIVSTPTPYQFHCNILSPGSLVGNSLYWFCIDHIIQFDLDGQSLAVIKPPPTTNDVIYRYGNQQIIQAVDGSVGLAILSNHCHSIQMWQRKVNCQSVTEWVLWKTIEMHNILGLPAGIEVKKKMMAIIPGYAEDNDGIFLHVDDSVYMVQLKSMQSRKLHKTGCVNACHSFESFYMPGAAIAHGFDGAEMLHET